MTSWLDFFLGIAAAYSPALLLIVWACCWSGSEPKRGRGSEPEVVEAKGKLIPLDEWKRRRA